MTGSAWSTVGSVSEALRIRLLSSIGMAPPAPGLFSPSKDFRREHKALSASIRQWVTKDRENSWMVRYALQTFQCFVIVLL